MTSELDGACLLRSSSDNGEVLVLLRCCARSKRTLSSLTYPTFQPRAEVRGRNRKPLPIPPPRRYTEQVKPSGHPSNSTLVSTPTSPHLGARNPTAILQIHESIYRYGDVPDSQENDLQAVFKIRNQPRRPFQGPPYFPKREFFDCLTQPLVRS